MNRLIAALFVTLLSVSFVYTQSGRRVVAKPTPAPTAKQDDPGGYSESRPEAGRAARIGERFPGLGNGGTSVTTPTAQTPAKPAENDDEVLKVETNLITIPVSVFDRNGLYIAGLRQKDFQRFEDNVEQEID